MMCSCSATIEQPYSTVIKRRLKRQNVSRETPCVMTELLWNDLTNILVRTPRASLRGPQGVRLCFQLVVRSSLGLLFCMLPICLNKQHMCLFCTVVCYLLLVVLGTLSCRMVHAICITVVLLFVVTLSGFTKIRPYAQLID